jgi:hypothetical protein
MIGSLIVLRGLTLVAMLVGTSPARADAPVDEPLSQKIAVWRFDALGIETELVGRLETLFRKELDRLVKNPLPSRAAIEKVVTPAEHNCTGEEKCLAAIGKRLAVDVVVTGTVGSLGDSYILNIKAVEAATAKQLQKITSEPLRGSPDQLIDGVRVAAYRLLAPQHIHGAIQVQGDLVGATVELDGKSIGKLPLPNQGMISKQKLGPHKLRVSAPGYAPFEETVDVRFQKISQVVVRLLPSQVIGHGPGGVVERRPIYSRTWFMVGAGVTAVVVGAIIGSWIGKVECRDGVTGQPC